MRVLFLAELADPAVGSWSRLTFQLARDLQARGHECAVVGAVRTPEEARPGEVLGVPVHRLASDYPVRWRAWRSLHNRVVDEPLERILADFRPDIVHAHGLHTHLGYHALTQARRSGAGVVFTAHDVMTFCYQKLTCFHGGEEAGGQEFDVVARASKCVPCQRLRFRPGRNARIRRVLERDVDRVTVVSDALGEVLRANQVPVHATVHNGLALQPGAPDPDRVRALRARVGAGERPLLAMGGRLHTQKGVGKLLEMLALLGSRHPALGLLVMGRREVYDQEFAAQARSLGVADRVLPTGWLEGEDLPAAYAAADVFATPSICFDTFGMVNLEAMEHSKPVVATSFGGSAEVVEHGVTGFIANPFDVQAFAGHLDTLLSDPVRARGMGDSGRRRLEERFTSAHMTDRFLEEYDRARAAAGRAAGAVPGPRF
ncbi:MAG: glycosyltransferase family 4 protein [Planctomycetota bacterium]|nr:glycosyltransferase family 4 protein [Planctomycetota bacterium]